MATRKRTIARVETSSLSIIRPLGSNVYFWCDGCAAQVPMVTPERAAEMAHSMTRAIYRRVERSEVHFVETAAGELFICCASLKAS